MKDTLSKKKIKLIKELAEWGRKYNQKKHQLLAPVMILTGTELFTTFSLSESWRKKGGKHAEFNQLANYSSGNLIEFAGITQ